MSAFREGHLNESMASLEMMMGLTCETTDCGGMSAMYCTYYYLPYAISSTIVSVSLSSSNFYILVGAISGKAARTSRK